MRLVRGSFRASCRESGITCAQIATDRCSAEGRNCSRACYLAGERGKRIAKAKQIIALRLLSEVVKADPHFGTYCSPASRLRGPPPQRL